MQRGYSVVRVEVGAPTRIGLDLLDLARRQADHLGRVGIEAKRRQTNRRYIRKGYLRFRFAKTTQADAFVTRLRRLGEPRIRWRRLRNTNRLRDR